MTDAIAHRVRLKRAHIVRFSIRHDFDRRFAVALVAGLTAKTPEEAARTYLRIDRITSPRTKWGLEP